MPYPGLNINVGAGLCEDPVASVPTRETIRNGETSGEFKEKRMILGIPDIG